MPERANSNYHSEEVHEILGTPPGWIVRRGITVILMVILIILGGTWFYKYPDIIPARIVILSENPPVQIVARETGKIDKLFVENNQTVSAGETLAVIENTANYSDACSLLHMLNKISDIFYEPEKFKDTELREDYVLGQYHSHFSSFISQLRSYQTFLMYNPYDQRIGTLKKQLDDYQGYIKNSKEQIAILKQDYELAGSQFFRDSVLFSQKIMTPADYELAKAAMLKQQFAYQNALTGLAGTQIIVNNLEQQVSEQRILKAEAENQLLATLKEKFDNLKNQLIGWEQSFILKSPVPGEITFTNFWSVNQFVTAGSVVFTVVPVGEQQIIGRAEAPMKGAGKVEPGQKVNIKLDNFPHLEYGILEGRVVNISKVPVATERGTLYTVEVELVNDMVTNYDKELLFSQEMQGAAEIITKDRRMIRRLIEPFFSRYKENVSSR
jgi:multidrug resistance efflux pump